MDEENLATDGTKKANWLARPRNDFTSETVFGVGNSRMALHFAGSGLIPSAEMMKPAKATEVPATSFLDEMVIPALLILSRTTLARANAS